jgi:acetyltransferase EpsM
MNKKIIILGGEGNGGVIANAIHDANIRGNYEWECVGYLNDGVKKGTIIDSFPVLGNIQTDIYNYLEKENYYFINAILKIDGQNDRINMFEKLQIPDSKLATFIHPTAYIAPNVKIGAGCVIMPMVAISSNTILQKGCIVMVSVTIGHDNIIEKYCHIAAQACVGAFLHIGEGVHIGLNSTIREHISIGNYATIGMGAVLTKDVGEKQIWAGNPAKFLRMAK